MMTKTTTPSFTTTMTRLDMALSRMPMTNTKVQAARINMAGRLQMAPGVENGSFDKASGTLYIPSTSSSLLRYSDHEAATVAALMAYSRIKSQPMIQAMISPKVA